MSSAPTLIVLRGNSASGKSTVAQALRGGYGYGLAWVEQDYLRRILLREHDVAGGRNIALIDLNVLYALAAGYHVVLEGILYARHYGQMLRALHHDFGGHWYYFDLPFEETLRRHATRPLSAHVGEEILRGWFQERDLLPFVEEGLILPAQSVEASVERILGETDLLARRESFSASLGR